MGTVTGMTAEAMQAIRDGVVVDGEVIGDHLILTKYDGTTIDAGNIRGPQGVPGIAGVQRPPLVTDLTPGTGAVPNPLPDGFEVFYVANATKGKNWHLRYNAASTSLHKWEVISGPALYDHVDGNSPVTTTGFADYTGPRVTVPLAGDYEISIGGRSINDVGGGGSDITQSFAVGATAALAVDGNDLYTPAGQAAIQQSTTREKIDIPANTLVAERVMRNAGSAGITNRWLRAVPIRVH